jgi:CRISPR-associated protein Cas1
MGNGILMVTGYGVDLRVERGHLIVRDGAGRDRRERRLSRVSPDLERVVVFGHSGTVTLQALRWIRDRDAAFIQIDHDGEVLVTSEPEGRSNAELLRAQVLASQGKVSLEIARELVVQKIQGQMDVLGRLPGAEERLPKLEQELERVREASTGKEIAQWEAQAALAYWDAWAPVPVRFDKPDRVPDHWTTVGGRRSPLLAAGNRKAVTPANAMLNYLYAVLEAEARLTALQFGFDPGIGIFHATYQGRESFPLDLMEPLRPMVDAFVLDLLEERTFTKDDFFETREGVCRIMPSVASDLSETGVLWRKPLRELTEALANSLLEAADTGSRGLLSLAEGHTADGRTLAAPLRKFRQARDDLDKTRWKRQLRERHKTNRAWERAEGIEMETVDFEQDVLPGLAAVQPGEIAEATGLSETYAAEIRRGEKTPHRRHWAALQELAEENWEASQAKWELEERFADVDFFREILEPIEARDLTHQEIADAVGLSRGYISEIMAGQKVPSLEHWPSLGQLAK